MRYKYKYIFPMNGMTKIRRGLYAVEESYNIVNGQTTNHISYSIEGKSLMHRNMEMTITKNNIETGSTTISQYDTDSLLTSEITSSAMAMRRKTPELGSLILRRNINMTVIFTRAAKRLIIAVY